MSSNNSPEASRHSTPISDTSAVLTPSRKVQALLAQFSDSDSDSSIHRHASIKPTSKTSRAAPADVPSETEDDDDKVLPHGRLAARLLGNRTDTALQREPIGGFASGDKPTKDVFTAGNESSNVESSADEVIGATRLRKTNATSRRQQISRSSSPLFFPSPSAARPSASSPAPATHPSKVSSPVRLSKNAKPKAQALLDRHRKERIAKEAAEIVRRAAGVERSDRDIPRRARGSSPADDSGESSAGSDDGAVNRMQKQTRPSRKASKRALEEMNRETQRMNRNMQLAHQATTRKKITKESLLSRFNFQTEAETEDRQLFETRKTTPSTSSAASDAESSVDQRATPPTSPLGDMELEQYRPQKTDVKDITHLLFTGQVTAEMHGALADDEAHQYWSNIVDRSDLSSHMQMVAEFFRNDITVMSLRNEVVDTSSNQQDHIVRKPVLPQPRLTRTSWVSTRSNPLFNADSDDEIEIVKDRGQKRKYAAFEMLPKRKAKQMPSHLALRSLAQMFGSDEKKRSINSAELQIDLKKRARIQAQEERRQKLEVLKSRGIVVQTAEERERDQQEVEDLVERARQEATEIQKREKELAKKDGTYVKDELDDEEDGSDDGDFEEGLEDSHHSGSEEDDEEEVEGSDDQAGNAGMTQDEAEETESDGETEDGKESLQLHSDVEAQDTEKTRIRSRTGRKLRVISDDEDEEGVEGRHDQTPRLPPPTAKTPQSVPWSTRKVIPGLQMSDDLPMGLSQAFAATMAESQTQRPVESQEQDSLDLTAELPSPRFNSLPALERLDSIDIITDSQPSASQTQPLNIDLISQSQAPPASPRGLGIRAVHHTPSQRLLPFDLTQDNGYIISPFKGNRFEETPVLDGVSSTVDTVILPAGIEDSPVVQRRGRLQRGPIRTSADIEIDVNQPTTAFQVMKQAMKDKSIQPIFDKKRSDARGIVDEAAEESEDEYAGLGGASDDSGDDEENDDDRRMIDEDTQVGKGDEAKLAGLFADRERERDEKEVSKLLKDITTGALRRKRGVGDDLDLSDEEDITARRREAKRREFARMRRELLKDEAVGKIAEDKKKEAFLRSIEDRDGADDDEEDFEEHDTAQNSESQNQSQNQNDLVSNTQGHPQTQDTNGHILSVASDSRTNRLPSVLRRTNQKATRKPATLAEIRESVSFLIEEPESQAAMVDLGLSDSEDEPEAYVNLDRHFKEVEADENNIDQDMGDLGDFIVADDLPDIQESQDGLFKKPEVPRHERAPFAERRTKHADVVDRLSLLRQASSSASSIASTGSASTKMAFLSSKTGSSIAGLPSLLRRATTNSSLGSMSGRDNVSATGVVTSKTERGDVSEKEFIRKGNGGRRNAVNFQAERKNLREEKMSARAGVMKASKGKKGQGGFLGGLFRGDSWE